MLVQNEYKLTRPPFVRAVTARPGAAAMFRLQLQSRTKTEMKKNISISKANRQKTSTQFGMGPWQTEAEALRAQGGRFGSW